MIYIIFFGKNGLTDNVSSSAAYTAVWNVLDYPACVFPVTRVNPVLDVQRPRQEFLNDKDKANYDFCMSCLPVLRERC